MSKTLPYLLYYLRKPRPEDQKYPTGLSRLEFEYEVLKDMLSYHYSYGVGGYLSERSTLEGIFSKITDTDRIDRDYMMYLNPSNTIASVAVTREILEERVKESETDPYFLKWVTDITKSPWD